MTTTLYTLGFTKKDAEQFFTLLLRADVRTVIDVRLNNVSQLAGFAKRNDLAFFLRKICDCTYLHLQELAPTKELLDSFKHSNISWAQYERSFNGLLATRHTERYIEELDLDHACLLCSEDTPEHCHRRLVAEYLARHNSNIDIRHL
jgi:uncharacterized protein (DUF488 family)